MAGLARKLFREQKNSLMDRQIGIAEHRICYQTMATIWTNNQSEQQKTLS